MNAAARLRAEILAKYPGAVLTGRSLTSLKHRLPDLPDGRQQFSFDGAIGPLHYKDDQGVLQEIDTALENDGADGFTVRTNRTPCLLRMANTGKRRFYPNRYDPSRYVEFSALPSMDTPIRGEDYLAWDRPHIAARMQSIGIGVKFTFTLKDALAPTSISFNVTLVGLTRQGRSLLADGVPVAVMRLPTAVDAVGAERACTFTLTSGKVTIALDTSGLVFPIEIDPTVSESHASEDATYRAAEDAYANDGTYVYAGASSATSYRQGAGMRFAVAGVPAGITVSTGYLRLMPAQADAGTDTHTTIRAYKLATGCSVDTKALFITYRWATEYHCAAVVDWSHDSSPIALGDWAVDSVYRDSPELKAIIQEIVNNEPGGDGLLGEPGVGWGQTGSTFITLFWDDYDDLSAHSAGNRRRAWSMENGTGKWPLLHFEYTPHVSFGQIM